MPIKRLIYRHRYLGKRLLTALGTVLPRGGQQALRNVAERIAFSVVPEHQEATLPPIFNAWGAMRLSADAAELGIGSPETLCLDCIERACLRNGGTASVLSAGSGAGHLEIALAIKLRDRGHDVTITCLELNPDLVAAGMAAAKEAGVEGRLKYLRQDCNTAFQVPAQDVIIVNQFFHHVVDLETFCRSLRVSLAPEGELATSDVVGRNGHMPWPSAQTVVDEFWQNVPESQRLDRHTGQVEKAFLPVNHAAYSNEGIRAQDVVHCLHAEFAFARFFTFGGAIMPFVERRLGFNFDPGRAEDLALIRSFAEHDHRLIVEGAYPAANMIAVLCHRDSAPVCRSFPATPEQHMQRVEGQKALIGLNR